MSFLVVFSLLLNYFVFALNYFVVSVAFAFLSLILDSFAYFDFDLAVVSSSFLILMKQNFRKNLEQLFLLLM